MNGSSSAAAICFAGLAACHAAAVSARTPKPVPAPPSVSVQAPAKTSDWTAEESALQSGELYEKLGEFSKAEQQFLAAAKATDPKLRTLALEGVKRTAERAQQARESGALVVADEYERRERWERARDAYADVVKTATGANLKRATDGMRRMQDRLLWEDRASSFDTGVLWLGRILAAGLVVWWLARSTRSIWTTRRSVKVFPFVAQKDEASKEIVFWLAYVRAKLRSATPTPGALLMVSYSLPYMDLPGLPSDVPEIDDPTLGETKVPLKDFLNALGRPLVRISGGWTSGTAGGRAYAEIERRRLWHGYAVRGNVSRAIAQGPTQASDLELFSYDVLIRAAQAHGK